MDHFIATQVEKAKREAAEKRNRKWQALLAVAEEALSYHLRKIEAVDRFNQSQERHFPTHSLQSQLRRDVALSNEAAARVLRPNLAEAAEPTESSASGSDSAADRPCRVCDSAESCVLILPCRHLCLCGSCRRSVHVCPICDSDMTITINVNMS